MNFNRACYFLLAAVVVSVATEGISYAQGSPPQVKKKKSRPVKTPSKELLAIQAAEAKHQAQLRAQAEQKSQQTRAAQKQPTVAETETKARADSALMTNKISQSTPTPKETPKSALKRVAAESPHEAVTVPPVLDSVAGEKSIQEAEALMKAGKPAEAYALLEPLEFDRSGEVSFDYLIGHAALESGQPDKATLAFERVLAIDPNFVGVRLDMARAHYLLGDYARAKSEFNEVMKQDPPEEARMAIQQYLDAIEAGLNNTSDTRVAVYLEATVGHDSNINSATSQTSVFYNNTATLFALTSDSTKISDNYSGLSAGLDVMHVVTEKVSLYAGADVQHRAQFKYGNFNVLNLGGRAGMLLALGQQDSLRVGMLAGEYELGSEHYRDNLGMNSEWTHAFSQINQMTVFGQQVNYRFVDTASQAQDFNQRMLGTGWTHLMQDGKAALFGSLLFGQEIDVGQDGGRADGDKRFFGGRVGGQAAWNDKIDFFANAGAITGAYAKYNTLFYINRRDTQSDATVGANWHWDKHWSMRTQIAWSRNNSNISVDRYERVDASLTVRRDFN